MTYDEEAQKLAIKAIGTVESNLNYMSVNYNDPITIGFMQWYGTRAANILTRIKSENGSSWVGIPSSLDDALAAHSVTDTWWTTRYLTSGEGTPLKLVLNNNKTIQNTQAVSDMEAYKEVAVRQGMDADGNTNAMIFFFVMYHQSPKRALSVLASAGPNSDIDRMYSICLNEPVLSQYRTRYTRARDIIKSGDTSGIDDLPGEEPDPPNPGGDTGGLGISPLGGVISYINRVGDTLHVHFPDGQILTCVPNGRGWFLPSADSLRGAVVPPPDVPPVTPDPGTSAGAQLVAWMVERQDRYAYSQGASRLLPDQNGYTDCSALVHYCYAQVLGIEIGTYTGNQYNKGTLVAQGAKTLDESLLQLGDLIFFDWKGGGVDHVDMWMGGGMLIGHGGPDNGPDTYSCAPRISAAVKYWVRRHI